MPLRSEKVCVHRDVNYSLVETVTRTVRKEVVYYRCQVCGWLWVETYTAPPLPDGITGMIVPGDEYEEKYDDTH